MQDNTKIRIHRFPSIVLAAVSTIGILSYVIGDLLWALGNPCLISDYYKIRFSGPLESNIWLIKELGFFGCTFLAALLLCYINIMRELFNPQD